MLECLRFLLVTPLSNTETAENTCIVLHIHCHSLSVTPLSCTLRCLVHFCCCGDETHSCALSVDLHWSQADQCCPDSCSCECDPWCGGVTVCPERCSLRRLLWRSRRSDSGVSWGVSAETDGRTKGKNNSTTSGQVSTHRAILFHSETMCHGPEQWTHFLVF